LRFLTIFHAYIQISRNSTFFYKGKPVKIRQVAEELGVRYVLEGSVQKIEDNVRVTAQLIDAVSGMHLWAERYDRDLKDLFALQDEITMKIVTALRVKLTEGENLLGGAGTNNLDAYLKYLQARKITKRKHKESYVLARNLIEEAIALDPEYADAYLMLSASHLLDHQYGLSESPEHSLQTAVDLVQKNISLAGENADASAFLGRIYLTKKQYDRAIAEGKRAVDMAPNSSFAHAALAFSLKHAGKPEEAIIQYKKAIRLSPISDSWHLADLGNSYGILGRYEEAISAFSKAIKISPESPIYMAGLAAMYLLAGRHEEAQSEIASIIKKDPKFTLKSIGKGVLYKDSAYPELVANVLREAGLPEPGSDKKLTKLSIAVLPFVNMSNDPEQEYFSDGMTDDIITDLSKIKDLLVISRNSIFTYKGQGKKIPEIAKELNVRYVLEGSVRRAGGQVRINAQLIDAETDHHVWADRFDSKVEDIFDLQDKVTEKIVTALALNLSAAEVNILASKGTDSIVAHDIYLKGKAHLRRWTPDDLVKAINYFKQASEVDPSYSQAYVGLAQAYKKNIQGGKSFIEKTGQDFPGSRYLMRHYLESAMKNPIPDAYSILASLELARRHYREALKLAEKAVTLSPNSEAALRTLGWILVLSDRPKEAIPFIKKAMRLNPLEGNFYLEFAYMSMGKYEEALESAEQSLVDNPNLLHTHVVSAVSYAHLGREDEAKEAFNNYLEIYTDGMYPDMQSLYSSYNFKSQDVFNRFVDGLVKAGFIKDSRGYYEVDEANKLNGQEISELMVGKTTIFFSVGIEFLYHWSEEGVLVFHNPITGISYKGKGWIEADTVCNQFEDLYESVTYCIDVYYNPKGNAIEKSQYLLLSDTGLTPFSIKE